MNRSIARRGTLLLSFLLFMAAFVINSESRSFTLLGCLGEYDLSKFAELDHICEECYQIYREPELNFSCRARRTARQLAQLKASVCAACRRDCFRNDVFDSCVDALKLSHEKKKLLGFVDEIFG